MVGTARWAIAWAMAFAILARPQGASAEPAALRPDQAEFRALYQELVETDTSATTGSCTALASKIADHLRQAGYTDDQITLFSVQDRPQEGGLAVFLTGSSKTLKPLLLLGHIDVVAAKREDWTRDPYKMVEENGYFFGRGAADMKAMDAIWIDAMSRFKKSGYHPKRTIKLALTCGEEGGSPRPCTWAKNRRRITGSRRPIRAATAPSRYPTMRSTSWPTPS